MDNSGRGKASNSKNKNLGEALISVVDDDRLMRSSTRRLLLADGFRVEAFASAEEFLASELAEETACLILDLRMPGMDGLELQRRLAGDFNPVPIIFLSAHASADDERRALQAGAVEFLQKPVNKNVLLLAIRNALKTPPDDKRKIL
jgi:FixJ family two-component response regulator